MGVVDKADSALITVINPHWSELQYRAVLLPKG